MIPFTFYRFETLLLPVVAAECRRRQIDDFRAVAVAYAHWQQTFFRRAWLFYRAQYLAHYRLIWEAFCAAHHLLPSDPLPEWLEQAWAAQREETGLREHEQFLEAQRVMLEQAFVPLADQRTGSASPDLTHPLHFDALWFRSVTRTTPEEQARLRALPYEDYLQSPRWRQLRAAMMLLHEGRCQGERCHAPDDSWYGDENLIDVHHLSYARVADERYEDVRLLCHRCHEKAHEVGLD
nr:MAG: hypothetical protein DIU68_17375 [Chloroflexota bacterium]